MDKAHCNVSFFLGANTPQGFVSFFDELYEPLGDWQVYIIKGGPGSGKSTLMKKAAAAFEELGYFVERIYCSGDPGSLDAVILPDIRACIADGTAPHVLDPKYPGALETIVNMGECWDTELLRKNATEIKMLSGAVSALFERSAKFLNAASSLQGDTLRLVQNCTDGAKIIRYASRLAHREFKKQRGTAGKEHKRFLSAVSSDGVVIHFETLYSLCDRFYVIEDEYGAVSPILLDYLKNYALTAGYDVISCWCPMAPKDKIDHLIIPDLGLCFFTSNAVHKPEFEPTQRIHARRFIDMEELKKCRHRIGFNRKASIELISESVRLLNEAKSLHDTLETFYTLSMNFEAANQKTETVIGELFERAEKLKSE